MYRCIWLIQSYPALEGVPLGMHWQGILYSYKEGLRVPCQSIGIVACTNKVLSIYLWTPLSSNSSPAKVASVTLGMGWVKKTRREELKFAVKSEHKTSQAGEANRLQLTQKTHKIKILFSEERLHYLVSPQKASSY